MIPVKKTTRYIFTFSFIQPLNISGEGGGPYDKKRKKSKHYNPNMRDRIRAMLKDRNGPSPSAKGAKSFRERRNIT